jgi:hypothetical protein
MKTEAAYHMSVDSKHIHVSIIQQCCTIIHAVNIVYQDPGSPLCQKRRYVILQDVWRFFYIFTFYILIRVLHLLAFLYNIISSS